MIKLHFRELLIMNLLIFSMFISFRTKFINKNVSSVLAMKMRLLYYSLLYDCTDNVFRSVHITLSYKSLRSNKKIKIIYAFNICGGNLD